MKTRLRISMARLAVAAAGLFCALSVPAMTPGPTRIIQCPGSDEIRQVPSIGSGNTFGAQFWTDGYMVAPMLPDFPAITRCTQDGPIFWIASAKVVGEISPWGGEAASAPPAWKRAESVRALRGDEFLEAIAQGLGDSDNKLSYLRRRAWWDANHARRPRVEPGPPVAESDFAPGSAARANLEALVASMDESNPDQLLFKAEGLRQLARFGEAEKLLQSDKLTDPRMQAFVTAVKARTLLHDARVAKVKTDR